MKKYYFSENNSGGRWWLDKAQYERLFASGWKYEPTDYDIEHEYDKKPFFDEEKNPVPYGWRKNLVGEFSSLQEAVEEWERATGEDFFSEGCNCCGCPFSIHSENYDDYTSGDSVSRETIRPW